MKKKYFNLALLLALSFSPIAALKAASLIGINYGSDLNVNLNSSVDTSLDTDVSQPNSDTVLDLDSNINNSGTANVDVNTNANTSIREGSITVTREDLNVDLPGIPNTGISGDINATAGVNAITNSSSVSTDTDLRTFALTELRADENLEAMSFANDNVMVSYKAPGRFLGFIPIEMNIDVMVDQEGNVAFDYPWYGFLVTKNEADLEAKIKASVDATLASEASGGWTNSNRAEIASAIATTLKTNYEARVNADSDTE
jgi:hypothetical protein